MTVETCVIFNPTAARGRAGHGLAELRRQLSGRAKFWPTERPGHAEDLARAAALAGMPVVAAAGGDGTVHEVANGILQANRPEARLAVYPLGSANDYDYSLHIPPVEGGLPVAPGSVRAVDIGHVGLDNGRERYFVNTVGLGFSGAVTIESRRIPYLRGLALYGLGFLRAWRSRYATPETSVTLDDWTHQGPTLSLTVAIGHREGSFLVAPNALLDDGYFDYLLAGALSRWEVLRLMPKVAGGKLPKDYAGIWQGRCREVHVACESPLTVHLDGEFLCRAPDKVHTLKVHLLPRRLLVQMTDRLA